MTPHRDPFPFLTTDQMIEVDRLMMEVYGIDLVRMMENAGRNLAHLARERFLSDDPRGKTVVALVGSGGNGGGALVAARRLHGYGATVHVYATKPRTEFTSVPAHQAEILEHLGVPIHAANALHDAPRADLILDGVIGYSLEGDPRDTAADLIHRANTHSAPVLALDVPSGLDSTTGVAHDPTVQAAATMTLALPKTGLRAKEAEAFIGELYVADIGVPPELYAEPSLSLTVGPIFYESDLIRLR